MTPSRTRMRILVLVGSLLTLGAATGVVVDRAAQLHGIAGFAPFSHVRHDPLGVVESRVDLRPEQRERIAAILNTHQRDVDTAWQEAHERILATVGNVISEIAAELDPEQREQFRGLVEDLHGPEAVSHIPSVSPAP